MEEKKNNIALRKFHRAKAIMLSEEINAFCTREELEETTRVGNICSKTTTSTERAYASSHLMETPFIKSTSLTHASH